MSVIVPCFNGSKWLGLAILSLLNQSYREIEILVYDDGSTDNSGKILQAMSRRDSRIRIISSDTNKGIVNALNSLIKESNGEYIARMDADDFSLPDRISKQVRYIKEKDLDLCGSWFIEIGQGLSRTVRWTFETDAVHAALIFQNSILHPTVLAKRDLFTSLLYREDYLLAEDYDLFSRASQSYRLGNLPEVTLRYRRHFAQATQLKRDRMEKVTRKIRAEALVRAGISPSLEEERVHSLIRAPVSIHSLDDLLKIEAWLLKLYEYFDSTEARSVVSSQWLRACIRAAPLRRDMWTCYKLSDLRHYGHFGFRADMDIFFLASLGLEYSGSVFSYMRRLGLSA